MHTASWCGLHRPSKRLIWAAQRCRALTGRKWPRSGGCGPAAQSSAEIRSVGSGQRQVDNGQVGMGRAGEHGNLSQAGRICWQVRLTPASSGSSTTDFRRAMPTCAMWSSSPL